MIETAFTKMNGAGNDFVIIDNRVGQVPLADQPNWAKQLCRRRFSVGADGILFIEPSEKADFKWRFYNADGSRADMCGNAARCAARYAYLHKIAPEEMAFETGAGLIRAIVSSDRVTVRMVDPKEVTVDLKLNLDGAQWSGHFADTGVPHYVIEVDDIEAVSMDRLAPQIRYHDQFAPNGTNVNFIAQKSRDTFWVRTYERGVEAETLACGTGVTASALIMNRLHQTPSPIHVITRGGGVLLIHFEEKEGAFYAVDMEGDARIVCHGALQPDAWV